MLREGCPLPSCPASSAPQHQTDPLATIEQECESPAVTCIAFSLAGKATSTGVTFRETGGPELPSCCSILSPQHLIPPVDVPAQAWARPAAICVATTPAGKSTETGANCVTPPAAKLPDWPAISDPQQLTRPAVDRKHVNSSPATMDDFGPAAAAAGLLVTNVVELASDSATQTMRRASFPFLRRKTRTDMKNRLRCEPGRTKLPTPVSLHSSDAAAKAFTVRVHRSAIFRLRSPPAPMAKLANGGR
jgi:hypothetical protein